MAAFRIGLDAPTGNYNPNRNNTSNHQLFSGTPYTRTAVAGDFVNQLGIRIGGNAGDGVNGVELGLYDITSGVVGAPLVVAATIAVLVPNTLNLISISDTPLTAGHIYCVGFRVASTDNVTILCNYGSSTDAKWSSRTGSVPLDDWNDNNNDSLIFRLVADGDNNPAPSVNPSGTDISGQAGDSNNCLIQNLAGATPTAIALYDSVSGITTTQSDFSFDTDTISYTVTRGELPYKSTLQIRVTLDNASILTLDNFELLVADGFQFVTLGSTLVDQENSIVDDYTGDPLAEGMQILLPLLSVEGGTLTPNVNSSFTLEWLSLGEGESPPEVDSFTYYLWDGISWKSATRTINTVEVEEEETPDGVTFVDVDDAELDTEYLSNVVTISGLTEFGTITTEINNGSLSVNDGDYLTESQDVENGDTLRLKLDSSSTYSSTETIDIRLGASWFEWNVNTGDEPPPVADNISFTTITGAVAGDTYTSVLRTITGNTGAIDGSVSGGQYSINSGDASSDPISLEADDTVELIGVASMTPSGVTIVVFTYGEKTANFRIITAGEEGEGGDDFTVPSSISLSSITINSITITGI